MVCNEVYVSSVTNKGDVSFIGSDPGRDEGDSFQFTCFHDDEYEVVGSDTRTCTSNEWVPGGDPKCQKINKTLKFFEDNKVLTSTTFPLAILLLIAIIIMIYLIVRMIRLQKHKHMYLDKGDMVPSAGMPQNVNNREYNTNPNYNPYPYSDDDSNTTEPWGNQNINHMNKQPTNMYSSNWQGQNSPSNYFNRNRDLRPSVQQRY